jgi:hypothetical protein
MKKKNVERLRAEDKRKLEGKDMEEVISWSSYAQAFT